MHEHAHLVNFEKFEFRDLPRFVDFGASLLCYSAELHPGFYICCRAKNSLLDVISGDFERRGIHLQILSFRVRNVVIQVVVAYLALKMRYSESACPITYWAWK